MHSGPASCTHLNLINYYVCTLSFPTRVTDHSWQKHFITSPTPNVIMFASFYPWCVLPTTRNGRFSLRGQRRRSTKFESNHVGYFCDIKLYAFSSRRIRLTQLHEIFLKLANTQRRCIRYFCTYQRRLFLRVNYCVTLVKASHPSRVLHTNPYRDILLTTVTMLQFSRAVCSFGPCLSFSGPACLIFRSLPHLVC